MVKGERGKVGFDRRFATFVLIASEIPESFTYSYIGILYWSHATGSHDIRCLQRGPQTTPAGNPVLSGASGTACRRDRGNPGLEQPSLSKHLRNRCRMLDRNNVEASDRSMNGRAPSSVSGGAS